MRIQFIFCLILVVFLLFGCAQEEEATPIASLFPTETATPSITPTPRPTTRPTATVVPTPVVPNIAVAEQTLSDDGRLTVASVISPQPGWLVLYAQQDGEIGNVLGYTPVATNLNQNLTVTIEPLQATAVVVAMLHVDAGEPGEFEFPDGPDQPLLWESAIIATPFTLDFQLSLPAITVSNQDIGEEGLVMVDSVLSPQPGWLVIHADDQGELGAILGFIPLQEGINEDLIVPIRWRDATPTLYAVIYEDVGQPQRFDYPGVDMPFQVNGNPVIGPFTATFPPDVFVLDQPIINSTFIVERVISNGPGWLVVYFDNEGRPGLIIGSAPLKDGLNEQVVVEVLESAVTPILHIRLHEDTEPGDDFDFPRVDPPILYQDRLPETFTFRVNAGNYVIVYDQTLAETNDGATGVTISRAVVDIPAWVALHADDNGEPGQILGRAHLSPGINRDLMIEVEPEQLTDTVYAVLYLDSGEEGVFEFPDGPDVPLQRNLGVIEVPFFIQEIGD